jgi:hypothetical protein
MQIKTKTPSLDAAGIGDLQRDWNERVVMGVAASMAVLIVAIVAVLFGMT